MSFYEKTYEEAYQRGYIEGYDSSRSEQRRRDDGGRAGSICIAVTLYAFTAFALASSIVQLLQSV